MTDNKNEQSNVSLSEWIAALREEITLASAQRAYQVHELSTDYPHAQIPNFSIKNISIEVEINTSRSTGVDAGIKFWVMNGDVNAKKSTQITQRLKFDIEITNELLLGGDNSSIQNSISSDHINKDNT